MGKLYNLAQEWEELFSALDEMENDPELLSAWFDTLEGMEGEFDDTAIYLAVEIKRLNIEINGMKEEQKALAERRATAENKVARLQDYIKESMQKIGKSNIENPKARISLRNTPPAVHIQDEKDFIEWAATHNDDLLKFSAPTIDKTKVKDALKSGKELPGATLESGKSINIK